ncbi:MAG: xanthine dehydrogenase family protein, partial [Rhodoferax sp.]|nr:xanthine dehydrogenase family protein [Rhodoferax sp.]
MSDAQQRFGSGRSVLRIEDDLLLRGQGCYTDDLPPEPGLEPPLRVCFVRSAYPHARIRHIDASAARALPGVVAVYTGADLVAAGVRPMAAPTGFRRVDGPQGSPERWPLAVERVRHVGEALAMVVAGTLEQARDAAEALEVDLEEQPMVVDLAAAVAPGAPRVSDGAPDNIAAEKRYGDAAAVQQAFAQAAHRVRLRIVNQRLAALTLEPRSVMAFVDPADGRLTLRMSTQMPSGIRQALSKDVLGIPRDRIRVTVGDVGGGFGLKGGMHPEDAAVAWAAWTLRRPVKWIAERSEEFLSAATGRDLDSDAELALDDRGRILALRLSTLANVGAYATPTGVAIALMIGPWVQTSVYDIARVDFHFKAVMTHTAPVGAYRGAGRPEAIHTMERLIDEAARQTGLDRIALRRINLITPQQMPYTNPMAQVYDSGRFERVMDQALALADWQGFALREQRSRQAGRWRGLGIATFLEWTGGNVFEERVTIQVRPEGVIEVFSAVNGMGQGIATSLAQLVVDVFDVPLSAVRIVMGDTDRGDGFGSAGSRSIFVGGSAVRVGSQRALDRARERAAAHLEAAVADLDYQAGR